MGWTTLLLRKNALIAQHNLLELRDLDIARQIRKNSRDYDLQQTKMRNRYNVQIRQEKDIYKTSKDKINEKYRDAKRYKSIIEEIAKIKEKVDQLQVSKERSEFIKKLNPEDQERLKELAALNPEERNKFIEEIKSSLNPEVLEEFEKLYTLNPEDLEKFEGLDTLDSEDQEEFITKLLGATLSPEEQKLLEDFDKLMEEKVQIENKYHFTEEDADSIVSSAEYQKELNEASEEYQENYNYLQNQSEEDCAMLEQEATTIETQLQTQKTQIEAEMEAVSNEIEAVNDQISSDIERTTIKLS